MDNKIYQDGMEYQDWICDRLYKEENIILQYTTSQRAQFHSETRQGIEIKQDKIFSRTGNLYLVFKIKDKSGNWCNSGFLKDDNTWLIIIGDYNECFYFFKSSLKELRRLLLAGKIEEDGIRIVENERSQGLVIPIKSKIMDIYCGKHIKFK
jgi:hypothetical protein